MWRGSGVGVGGRAFRISSSHLCLPARAGCDFDPSPTNSPCAHPDCEVSWTSAACREASLAYCSGTIDPHVDIGCFSNASTLSPCRYDAQHEHSPCAHVACVDNPHGAPCVAYEEAYCLNNDHDLGCSSCPFSGYADNPCSNEHCKLHPHSTDCKVAVFDYCSQEGRSQDTDPGCYFWRAFLPDGSLEPGTGDGSGGNDDVLHLDCPYDAHAEGSPCTSPHCYNPANPACHDVVVAYCNNTRTIVMDPGCFIVHSAPVRNVTDNATVPLPPPGADNGTTAPNDTVPLPPPGQDNGTIAPNHTTPLPPLVPGDFNETANATDPGEALRPPELLARPLLNVRVGADFILSIPVLDDGETVAMEWELISSPGSANADIAGMQYAEVEAGEGVATALLTGMTEPGSYVVMVTATDANNLQDTVTVTLRAVRVEVPRPSGSDQCVPGHPCLVTWETLPADASASSARLFLLSGAQQARSATPMLDGVPASGSANWTVPSGAIVTGINRVEVQLMFSAGFPASLTFQSDTAFAIATPFKFVIGGWGSCSPDCGVGLGQRARLVQCRNVVTGQSVPNSLCVPFEGAAPASVEECAVFPCSGRAFVPSAWSTCSATCGGGTQSRSVQCIDSQGNILPLSDCSGTPPATSRACNQQQCETFSWRVTSPGPCSAACGGGIQYRTAFCVSSAGNQVPNSRCVAGARPTEVLSCNTATCPDFFWRPGDWSRCTVNCGGGERTRTVHCISNGAEVAASSCPAASRPPTSVACNTRPCVTYAFELGPFGACSAACGGGVQTRSVSCVSSAGESVPLATCTNFLGTLGANPVAPASSIVCNQRPCDPCAGRTCSGRGTCRNGVCQCAVGYTGTNCERPSRCSGGLLDATGQCCPSSLLNKRGQCCPGASPVLDANGECCPSGNLDVCGVCGGSAVVVDALGVCCSTVLDAGFLCCASGEVDACGVCDGSNECSVSATTVGVSVDSPIEEVTQQGTSAFEEFTSAFKNDIAAALAVPVAQVNVRRVAAAASSRRRRLLSDSVDVDMEVLPDASTGSTLYEAEVTSLLGVAGFSVSGVGRSSVCGNGLCERGEACPSDDCCAQDCPYMLLACPVPADSDQPCGGRGRCMPGTGSCECYTEQGYVAADCSQCDNGWFSSGSMCMRSVTVAAEIPDEEDPADDGEDGGEDAGSNLGAIVGGIIGGLVGVVLVAAVAVQISKMRDAQRRKRVVAMRQPGPSDQSASQPQPPGQPAGVAPDPMLAQPQAPFPVPQPLAQPAGPASAAAPVAVAAQPQVPFPLPQSQAPFPVAQQQVPVQPGGVPQQHWQQQQPGPAGDA